MRIKRRKSMIIITILLLAIGYAAVSTILYINGTINISTNSSDFAVYFKSVEMTPMRENAEIEKSNNDQRITFNTGIMKKEGEKTTIEYVIRNDSKSYDANITVNCTATGSSEYFSISNQLGNRDISEIKGENYLEIKAQEEKNGKIEIEVIKKYTGEGKLDIPITCEIEAKAVGRENAITSEVTTQAPEKLCKRATSLHTESCDLSSTSGCIRAGYSYGEEIIYGNESITVGILTPGDAFDCDVDGRDGYNSETERFYYVTDLDEDTAVLVYSANTNLGVYDKYATNTYDYNNVNNNGPVTAVLDLPSTDQWRTTLYSNPRQILNEYDGNTTNRGNIALFDYENKASRLLTLQEVLSACPSNNFNNCKYFVENTKFTNSSYPYAYWLETPYKNSTNWVYLLCGPSYNTGTDSAYDISDAGEYGTRPAIEVKKSDIDY